ncbi:lactonase family protein [Alkalihalobacillus pseudalcaliphilus]|uniref:lactonase family protein n=1 Tax=Alkalihalobacillus pseudalcaliphilus TaxID=79884 RepID=UPI00064E0BED|nr:lactonase family protein [Alkalihalobacillus pseudalcaliphilus]KMK77019.1 6-phosphogluconolactonase [Alkalihalobacillus pseudalcaliphilus]
MSQLTAYVGTYTNGDSKGIYRFSFDPTSGVIDTPELVAELEGPTYLTISQDNQYLYAVAKSDEGGGIAAYQITDNEELEFINSVISDGPSPCHVSLDNDSSTLFSANYHRGQADVYPISNYGHLENPSSTVTHTGSGPNQERQEKAHAHYAGLTPDGKFVVVCDLGTDKVAIYRLDGQGLIPFQEIFVKPGSGPRHIAFHPNGKYAYVNAELSSEIIVFEYKHGELKEIQTVGTLPEDFLGDNTSGALHLSNDGKFIYVSNRGHDSVYVYEIDESTGMITFRSSVTSGGEHPRDFIFDPSGKYMFVANKDSSNIVMYIKDDNTGRLTKTEKEISIPNPVCIKFLHYR